MVVVRNNLLHVEMTMPFFSSSLQSHHLIEIEAEERQFLCGLSSLFLLPYDCVALVYDEFAELRHLGDLLRLLDRLGRNTHRHCAFQHMNIQL
jgi:hypothetical protein